MKPRDRVMASLEHRDFDRLPIKHLAVAEIDQMLFKHFQIDDFHELLDRLGHDFRDVGPEYRGPNLEHLESAHEHGIVSAEVWHTSVMRAFPNAKTPLANVSSVSELNDLPWPSVDWFDYSSLKEQCLKYSDYARILGYCELDFIHGCNVLRGDEQILIDMYTKDPILLELLKQKFEYAYEHIKRALEAADGLIDLVHVADDFGTQRALLISVDTFLELFGDKYRAVIALAHEHGARVMMHSCGSVVELIPTLIDLGLDILDVVQTGAAGMDLEQLKAKFGDRLAFSGSVCVQKTLPFGTPEDVRSEIRKRQEIFKDGGLIIGPSHQIQQDTPLENILEMYRAIGGLTE